MDLYERLPLDLSIFLESPNFDLNTKDKDGNNLLEYYENINDILLLLDCEKFDPNTQNLKGKTFTMIAFRNFHGKYDEIFLKKLSNHKRIDLNIRDNKGQSCIHIIKSSIELKILLENPRIDVNAKDEKGRTVLHLFVNDRKIVEMLLNCERFDVNSKDHLGRSAIFYVTDLHCFYLMCCCPRIKFDIISDEGKCFLDVCDEQIYKDYFNKHIFRDWSY